MLPSIIPILVLLARASARIIDIHIDSAEDAVGHGDSVSLAASCYWDGTSPFCAGGCSSGYSDCATSSCGDGACCITGYKKYCCRGGCPNLHTLAFDPPKEPEEPLHDPKPSEVEVTKSCYWDGTSPFCAGGCSSGYSDCATSSCGDGACCVTGYKKYCCRGGCSNQHQSLFQLPAEGEHDFHPSAGDNDDICGKDEFLCCPPGASRNKQCKCINKKKAPHQLFNQNAQSLLAADPPSGQLCKDKQTLCCNAGADENENCACIDE